MINDYINDSDVAIRRFIKRKTDEKYGKKQSV